MTALLGHRHRLPRGVTADDLDLRWLTPKDRRLLEEGRLRLPHNGGNDHPSTLVSVPENLGTSSVAWIDKGMAELIFRLNHHHDLVTEECCQGDADEPAYISFAWRGDLTRFQSLAGDALRGEDVEGRFVRRVVRFPHSQVRRITRAVRNA